MNTNPELQPSKKNTSRRRSLAVLGILAAYPLLTLVMALIHGDALVLQKVITRWALPAGLLFLISLSVMMISASRRQWLTSFLGFLGLMICITSLDPVAQRIIASLEDQYPDIAAGPLESYDAVVVLGGGTGLTTQLRPQAGLSGERIALAARLFNQGLSQQVVVTGNSLLGEESKYESLFEQSKYLLVGMGVDETVISGLDGRNTAQEIESLRVRPELWKGKRCGLITSAIHMPRAMRLAKAAGVEVNPIPADFIQPKGPFSPLQLTPSGDNIMGLTRAAHEYFGMLIGR